MTTPPPVLSDRIACLRSNAQAQEKCVWIPAPVHDLIIACLVRIFGRLEQLILLWQSGTLPPPQPSRAPGHAQHDRPARRQRSAAARRVRHRAPGIDPAAACARAPRHLALDASGQAPRISTHPPKASPESAHPPRAPPPESFKNAV